MLESRIAAIGGMRDAAQRGEDRRDHGHDHPGRERPDHRAGRDHDGAGGDVEPEGAEEGLEPHGEEDPPEEPDGRRDQADQYRLEEHGTEHLFLRGADGPQERELAAALGDDDREGVEDDERADEQGNQTEDEQERVEEREVVLEVVLTLGGDVLAAEHLDVGGVGFALEGGADVGDDLVLRHPGVGLHVDGVELAGGAEDPRRRGGSEGGDGGAEGAVGGAELHDAGERVVVAARLGDHRHGVTDLVPGVVGALLVDDHLVGGARAPAVHDVDRAQVTVGDVREPERGRALPVAAQRVAVLVDDDGEALHGTVGLVDALRAAHRRQEVGADGAPPAAEVAAEGLLGPDDRVGVLVDVAEQAVERVGDGRGEHERARDERDAEHHRDPGQQETDLLAPDAFERDLPHGFRRPGSSSCRGRCRRSVRGARRRWRRRPGTRPGRRSRRRSGRG